MEADITSILTLAVGIHIFLNYASKIQISISYLLDNVMLILLLNGQEVKSNEPS